MQRSGGCAPVAVSTPRANRRTQAAAGAAVETTEPPSPKWGRVIARAMTISPSTARVTTRWIETVSFDGDAASRAAACDFLRRRGRQSLESLEQRRRERQTEARALAAEALPERGQLGVERVDRLGGTDRIAVVDDSPGRERLDLDRLSVLEHDGPERQLVEQRLDRVRRPQPAVSVGARGLGRRRTRRSSRSPRPGRRAGRPPPPPSGWSCPGSSRSRARPAAPPVRTRRPARSCSGSRSRGRRGRGSDIRPRARRASRPG